MGTTCASVHIFWRGRSDDAAKAIARAYTKLGYERIKKPATEANKHVILLARPGERYVSFFDSSNADLDNGELKDAALAASRLLKTPAIFTSLYDSDSYEFVVFNNGRQVDLLMTDADTYDGPLKRLSDRSRVTQWSKIFTRLITADQIGQALAQETAFADDTIAKLCALVGLASDRPQMHYRDLEGDRDSIAAELYFTKKAATVPAANGQISLRNYFDRDNSRKLLVYPASWPMPLDHEELLTWLILTEGAGFRGGRATVNVAGPDGLMLSKGFMNGAKFHNGQIVGGYELPKNVTPDAAKAYLESKRFLLTPAEPTSREFRLYSAEYPNLWVPPITPDRTTQIIIVLQLYLTALNAGEWTINVTLQPHCDSRFAYELPAARVTGVPQTWLPVVSGLNPKTAYDTGDLAEGRLSDDVLDFLIRKSGNHRLLVMLPSESRALLESQQNEGRERNYRFWLHDLQHKQRGLPNERRLDHAAIASNVAIQRDQGQATLDSCRMYLEKWLHPLLAKSGEVRVRAERQMTESLHVAKMKKAWPVNSVSADKTWAKLFDYENEYQTIVMEFLQTGAELPFAGMGLTYSLRDRRTTAKSDHSDLHKEYEKQMMELTLRKMRGHEIHQLEVGHTLHVFNWVINHDECFRPLETSIDGMKRSLDAFAAESSPLQAWHGQSAWIPVFDQADSYQGTIYEDMSVLNFFRGVLVDQQFGLKDQRMTTQWCANVLRMVTPHMWLCGNLVEQVDKEALANFAIVTEHDGCYKIEKRGDCTMDDLELALVPVLPIESSRVRVLS
jgi:hypothetical protein